MQNNVSLVIEMVYYHMQYEWTCYFCNYNIIKQNHELTLSQRKRQTFSLRLKYAERKIITICTDIVQIYNGDDYDKIIECLSTLKNKILYIKKELVELYKNMDENFEQTYISLSVKGVYKICYDSIRLMKWLCRCDYYNNINYYDLIASVLYAKKNI